MAIGNEDEARGWRAANRARWVAHVRACRASGLSAAEYGCREGLDVWPLYRWRRVRRDEVEDAARGGERAFEWPRAPLFAEVQVAGLRHGEDACAIEVLLVGGRRLRVLSGFGEATLLRIVGVLEKLPCRVCRLRFAFSCVSRRRTCAVRLTVSRGWRSRWCERTRCRAVCSCSATSGEPREDFVLGSRRVRALVQAARGGGVSLSALR